jgi:ABC-type branched-subunit amino acid transport system substrate-binding protein
VLGKRWAIGLVAVLLCCTTACGARWSGAQRAEITARGSTNGAAHGDVNAAGASNRAAAQSLSAPGADAGNAPGATGQPDAGGAAPTGAEAAAGAADPAAAAASGPLPCAAHSDAPGVSDTTIQLGEISSLTGPVSGLGASSAAAVRSYVAFRNASGGVCGRQLALKEADDGTDQGRYRTLINELASQVLGIAGGFALGDVAGTDIVEQTGIPVVNVPSADSVDAAPTVFDINPDYENLDAVQGKYRYLHDNGAQKAAVVYLAVDQSRLEAQKQERLMKAAGIEVVQVQELPINTLSYDSAARGVANSGADYLFFIADAHGNGAMAQSLADTGYQLKYAEYFAFAYGTAFIDQAGSAAEGAVAWLRTLPNEEASSNEEMSRFLEWMDRTAPNDVADGFAADSWSGAKAFVDALEALPGPITRDALVTQVHGVDTYDAGGMLGPIRLGAKLTNACVIGMRVESGAWKRMAPDQGWLC